jgi:hypothetical protein
VAEAQQWLGGGSSLLGRARSLGPHPFATLALLGEEGEELAQGLPAVKTPFQVGSRGQQVQLWQPCLGAVHQLWEGRSCNDSTRRKIVLWACMLQGWIPYCAPLR